MRISVVVPVLNDSPMLAQCLAALALQTRPADEIVVVDNGSTDDTAAVATAGGARVVPEPVTGPAEPTRRGAPLRVAVWGTGGVGSIAVPADLLSFCPDLL